LFSEKNDPLKQPERVGRGSLWSGEVGKKYLAFREIKLPGSKEQRVLPRLTRTSYSAAGRDGITQEEKDVPTLIETSMGEKIPRMEAGPPDRKKGELKEGGKRISLLRPPPTQV